jgi:hypothetical protein
MPPPPVPLPGRTTIRWSRLVPTILIAALAIGVMQLATGSRHTDAAAAPNEIPASDIDSDHDLGLTVSSKQHQLEIRWNRESAVLANAEKGVMKITDDGITESLPFDQTQLRDGYVAYTPKTNDVNIRLEVTGKEGATKSESIRSVAIP